MSPSGALYCPMLNLFLESLEFCFAELFHRAISPSFFAEPCRNELCGEQWWSGGAWLEPRTRGSESGRNASDHDAMSHTTDRESITSSPQRDDRVRHFGSNVARFLPHTVGSGALLTATQ